MFGYVKPFKPEMKMYEYDTYKAVYCSLCKRLGKRYGHIIRCSLSYDFVFLALVGLSLHGGACTAVSGKCVYNPCKKCNYIDGADEIFDFSASAAVMMIYYKLCDDIKDNKGLKRLLSRIAKLFVHRKFNKAKQFYPDLDIVLKQYYTEQQSVEQIKDCGLDNAAEPTAKAMGGILCLLNPDQSQTQTVRHIGYCVGKWVYLIDALDDLDDDIKTGSFNPLKGRKTEDVAGTLNVCSTIAGENYELLKTVRYDNLVKNILYLGMPYIVETVVKKRDDKRERSI